ncbi:Sensory histidine kinase QseC [Castellaniella defragrans 65Phen]|uniref:histidine kinase n=1 Tax=Castellaniella defragrans (strain DSM 12143 / CCUG 39792 / 65Phen) TaxID=1437824 RepID=W8WTK4_CASD6|nr:ATP-binding protein [Castellaniella defragrans]CDM23023.1 Sensory histidine kinase QseC [Castellaniella defragrans 65Phen]
MRSLRWPWTRRRPGGPGDAPPARGGWSLRRRLLLAVMGTSIGLWLTSLAIVVGVAWFATSEVFDDALEEGSRLVLRIGLPGEAADGIRGPRTERGDTLKLRMYYQLVASDGRVLLRGEDTPHTAFLPDARGKTMATVRVEDEFWRVHVRPGPGGVTAQVAQPMEERLELLEDMAENLAWPALGLLAMLGLLSWLLIRRLLRPLEETAMLIDAKSPHDLTPVRAPNPPRELLPILDALNALLARLSTALDSERRFTADAAHELRTPLAALRMRVQLIERELRLPDAHLRQLRADLDRCTALVESLLALARLEPRAEPAALESVDLEALLDGLQLEAMAPDMRIERALAAPRLRAAPALLASALRNLIDNAARYGRAGGRIRIESSRLPQGGTRLAVRDDGAGVPPEQRARLGERFFRVLGTGQAGNGLGLSIVARIAALHGASLRFEDGLEGRGLGAVLDFPPD